MGCLFFGDFLFAQKESHNKNKVDSRFAGMTGMGGYDGGGFLHPIGLQDYWHAIKECNRGNHKMNLYLPITEMLTILERS